MYVIDKEYTERYHGRLRFGISNQIVTYYKQHVYVVSNLLGVKIRVNRLADYGANDTSDMIQVSDIKLEFP